ncbi:MAG: NUDIX domain-containing protein [Dysgonamonadaceae bacterium]|jgi:ADP-ribose pyrophosphatase YjhB (NUDIX family)|nr:NUDIX domain-containing protein [Dysgonamonadaceae bacterium]
MASKVFGLYTSENIHPGFSINCVILSFYKGNLKVLLYKFSLKKYWALPGGFMLKHEDADQAAYRILKSQTGLSDVFLKQFYLFSDPQRTIMEQNIRFVHQNATNEEEGKWLLQRFVSLGYYALVRYEEVEFPEIEREDFQWYDVDQLPDLYSDHQKIIEKSIKGIRNMLPVFPVIYKLLPDKFTMSELRKVYECFIGKALDRRNFQRKVFSEGFIVPLNEKKSTKIYNPTKLYSFNFAKKKIFYQDMTDLDD